MDRLNPFKSSPPKVAVVRLQGVIAASGRGSLSANGIRPTLEKAFRKGKPKALALAINSPGGSPVQSSLIGAHIRRLSEETEVPVTAFVEDVAASGGYWLASAADDIYADPSSILGSIGVISASFGFHELLERQGVERRVHTAGQDKSMLDPFRPEKPEDVERLKALQSQIHDAFIDHVKACRGDRLSDSEDLFTGEVWLGQSAVNLGLADGIGHLESVMRERYGDKVKFLRYGQRKSVLQRFGVAATASAMGYFEERSHWARFGL